MGKFGTLCHYFYSFMAFIVRAGLKSASTVALLASLGVGMFILGQKTNKAINKNEKAAASEDRPPLSTASYRVPPNRFSQIMAGKNSKRQNSRVTYEPAKDFPGKVREVVYWRDPKKSGAVLAAIFVGLYVFASYPLLIVLTYSALAVLLGTFGFRVFKLTEAHFKKLPAEHPFKEYLAYDLSLESEKVHSFAERAVACGQKTLLKLRSIVLVEDLLETAKAGLILWTLTYVGAWFSGLTLIVLAVIAVFSVPKVYELYKEPIDEYLELAQNHLNKITETIYEKVPMLKKSEHPQEPVKKDE
ncbi:hypothetical protein QR680_004976 [Steinernema hermaphroditum]|uniref:Reticulon-like protein n=1 Tax=Steinernema hermaphroditum TaxID=289476 RepID=A0AA39LUV7_9BILA|nr:hypothetical protein QR680_004976 [Steinernema hermaphroditum]